MTLSRRGPILCLTVTGNGSQLTAFAKARIIPALAELCSEAAKVTEGLPPSRAMPAPSNTVQWNMSMTTWVAKGWAPGEGLLGAQRSPELRLARVISLVTVVFFMMARLQVQGTCGLQTRISGGRWV